MTTWHLLIGILEAIVWYFFIWYLLSTLRAKERNLWLASFVLLMLAYVAFALCPWLRHTERWQSIGETQSP
ncbi:MULTISPECIES: hypothetical protein [Rhodopirellula]|uniref:Uncharacterized protein n=1 Tax=Rhodopirellula bahusiensis TaxID=2014065 RepID=A0A2G1W7P5_9BACT|nr:MULTISPECIES: hypothetical protein [Rhodopirellula]PHQ35062.1 hypothetical protein CEE69_11590 [Rhodopirellula bahusiensis]